MRIPPPRVRPSLRRPLRSSIALPIALLLGFGLACVIAYFPAGAQSQNSPLNPLTARTSEKRPEFVPGEVLVRFKPGTTGARVKSRATISVAMMGARSVPVELNHFGGSDIVEGLMLARVPAEDTLDAIKALRARSDVAYAEPNYIRYHDAAPNDTRYSSQWALQDASSGGISAEAAWNTTTGSQSVVVGVIDSGVDIGHGDLKDNIFVNPGEIPNNNIDDDSNGFIDDVNGWDFINNDRTVFDNADDDAHGTHVAGTIGARGNNALGIAGVNWNVQLMSLKVIGSSGGTDSSLLNSYKYALMMRQRGVNLRVLNNSYGSQRFSQSLLNAIKELGDAGVLFVAAAGNETANNDIVPHFPASFDAPNVISVAASNNGSFASAFSNRGAQSVHLAAPGQSILSTTPRGLTDGIVGGFTDPDGSTYSLSNGTSMASPHVAGVAALACAANPGISVTKLKAAVLNVDESGQYSSLVLTGGHLNANKAVQAAIENDVTAPASPGNFRISSQEGRRVELRWTEAGDNGTTGRAALNEIRFTDTSSGEQFKVSVLRAGDPGTERTLFVSIPLRHLSGQLSLRTFDNVGNSSTATVNVSVNLDAADPYIVSLSPAAPLTALNSGTTVGPRGDDLTAVNHVSLPFPISFFGFTTTEVIPSSNGALYIPIPPEFAIPRPNLGASDLAVASETNLESMAMVAGMWADLRTDINATDNVYMVTPDLDRVIFRWQAVKFGTNTPVNFEIELRRDGTIQTRYGSGNQNLLPVVVGISGGDPDTYLVDTHTATGLTPISLGNAQTVTFALRNPPPPPRGDLAVSMTAAPNPVLSGQNVTYNVRVTNLGPNVVENLVMTDVLPAGTTFVSCTTDHFVFGTCTGPAVGSSGTVTGTINTLQPAPFDSGIGFTIVAKVTAAPGNTIQNTASATSFRADPNPANNSASVTSNVVAETFFTGVRAIAAGSSHTTSVRNDGTVWVWGAGSSGQLGDGNSGIDVRSMTPVQVSGLAGVNSVADANGFVYALKSDGTVWGWGINSNGQLGDGTTTQRSRPVQTIGLTNVKVVDGGDFYGAAVKTDGSVWHWGASNGLISNNFGVNTTPVQLNGISNVSTLSAGANHLLMLKSDKTVWALGSNSRGELGDGTTTARHSPVQVPGLSNVARISAGAELSVVLKEDGTVWAWGNNRNGQLGPGGGPLDFDPNPNPVQVTGLPAGIKEISAGPDFILAVASDGTVWSWGNNSNSQLGQGSQVIDNPVPKQIPNFGNVVSVAGGNNHSAALKTDGSVWCWGANSQGEVGDGTTTIRFAPKQVSGLETVSSPSFNPPGGNYINAVNVVITCATPGATIHYTLNGNEPTESDPMIVSGGSVRITSFTFLRARAWKPGLVPSSSSFGQYDIQILPPRLLLEENPPIASLVAALDAVTLLRDPFPIVNTGNHLRNAADPNTRVVLFAQNIELAPGETAAAVTVHLVDTIGAGYTIPAEDVRTISNTDFKQVIFRLPNNLPPGTVQVTLRVHNLTSNGGFIRIKP